MINKIKMNEAACYEGLTVLETSKKINLIYGLNGTGKSVMSDFLYDSSKPEFSNCSIEGDENEDILVYNQSFIRDYFYEPDTLKGVFTLSKENKDAEEKVISAEQAMLKLSEDKKLKESGIVNLSNELSKRKDNAQNKTWEIKSSCTGGDRVLEYCLSGLNFKKLLFNHLLGVAKPSQKPDETINQIKKEVESIKGESAQKYDFLPTINFTAQDIESNQLFQTAIIGNENSAVAGLIKKLKNSDWVKKGLDYIPDEVENEVCPFCQERTITKVLFENIKNYFNETYENEIRELKKLLSDYETAISSLQGREGYESNLFINEKKIEFTNLYNACLQCLSGNKVQIIEKLKTPSQKVSLSKSVDKINEFNCFISEINKEIKENNIKIDNKEVSLNKIKDKFWNIMRWDYDQTVSVYQTDKAAIELKIEGIKKGISEIESKIVKQKNIILEQQKKTVNIKEAIDNINNGLIELGIDGFKIEKHSETMYRISRAEQCDNTFKTLSEGEKMIISFLYFRELCKGKKNASSYIKKKIVVIDDPISSLSHIHIFNIGELIKKDFFNSSNYEQIFILTHSLYFFYEMSDAKHERRHEMQKLFRISKNCDGSKILDMKYEEIQNDYHSYWFVVMDKNQPKALIANCMRNIIEYFFAFIETEDLNNVFQKPKLQETKYRAFRRYISRESHSLGQNIFDFKEFDYEDFKEAFHLVFSESGYPEHYNKMMKKSS